MMKKLAIGLALVVVLLVGALFALPSLVPVEEIKAQITAGAKDATGRELAIDGPLNLSVFPRIEIEATEVSLANTPESSRPEMATIERMLVRVDLLSLFTGEVAVDSFVLVEPKIHLEVDESGAANWNFAGEEPAEAESASSGTAKEDSEESGAGVDPGLAGLSLGDVRIEGGLLTYENAQSGDNEEVSDINMRVSLAALDEPLAAEGSATWNGEVLDLGLAADNLSRLLGGESMAVTLDLRGRPVTVSYRGDMALDPILGVSGLVDLDVPSLRGLADWTRTPIEGGGSGLGPLAVGGRLVVDGGTYGFEEATIRLDDMTAKGGVSIDLGGEKPYLGGTLAVDLLDLNPYLPAPKGEAAQEGTATAEPTANTQKSEEPEPWSDEPIDLTALKLIDADFDLSVGGIRYEEIKIGQSALTLSLKDGLLVTDLSELALYDGKGTAWVQVDARGETPRIEKRFDLEGVTLEPLLTDAADFNSLEGTGALEVSIKTSGKSQRAMVEALSGEGAVTFIDGAVKGINLAAMARNLTTAFADSGEAQKTDFAELSGTFQISRGILRNKDLKMLNPLIRVTGKGKADLPAKTVDYRMKPKAVADTKGQGGDGDAKGLAVPIIAEGPWHDISYRPDLGSKGKAVKKTVKDAAGGLKSNLTGGGDGGDAKDTLKDAGKALKNLFD